MHIIKLVLADYIREENPLNSKTVFKKEELEENKALMELDYPESDADLIASKCNFIAEFRKSGLSGNEPAWYAALGVVRHCIDGGKKCHEFSSQAEDYKEKLTDQKLYYLEQKEIQPTCCSTLEQFGFCKNCKFRSKVKSPIQLGVVVTPIVDEAIEKEPLSRAKELSELAPKKGWLVGKQGIFRVQDDETIFVTATPFFIVDKICESFDDETLITVVIRYSMRNKFFNFKLPLKYLADNKKLEAEFNGRGIFIAEKKHLKLYLIEYANNLKHIEPHQVINSMGWQPNDSFVFNSGGDSFSANGDPTLCIMDQKMINFAKGFTAKGSIEEWVKIQDYFDSSDSFLPHIFSIMCSMGAPLLSFTVARGIALSLQGESGCGKSLGHEAAMSVWGNPETAGVLGTNDTHTAWMGRLAVVKNMPLRLDEATLIPPKKLTGLIYELVNGRGRSRSTIDGSLSSTAAEWHTVTLITTNKPLLESDIATLSEAERNRILELEVIMHPQVSKIGKSVGSIIRKNHGLVGKLLIEAYIKNKDKVIILIDKYQTKFQDMVGEDKRFWVSCGAIAFTAATISNLSGLYKFDMKRMSNWFEGILKEQTALNSSFIAESRGFAGYDEFVGALKDWLTGSILILNQDYTINQSPVKEIKARIIKEFKGNMLLYVRSPALKEFVKLHYVRGFNSVKKELGIKDSVIKCFGSDVVRCYEFILLTN